MSDGRIEIKVDVEDSKVKKLSRSLDDITSSAKGTKSSLDNIDGSSLRKTGDNAKYVGDNLKDADSKALSLAKAFGIVKLASAAFDAIKNAIGDMVGELNDSLKAWRTFEGNISMLGKSKKEIDAVKKSLQTYATETVYSASDMAQTYSQMAAIGYESVEQLVKGMGGLAASAEDPKQAMKTLSQQMTQALSKPELAWQDFKLMMEQAPAGMSAVAKEMGMTLDELVVAIQDGEIASKDFADAVAKVGTNADFTKLATEYKTIDQAMDGLQETIANKLLPMFEKLTDTGIKAISGLADAIDKFNLDGFNEIWNNRYSNKRLVFDDLVKSANSAIRDLQKVDIKKAVNGLMQDAVDTIQNGFDFSAKMYDTMANSIDSINWGALGNKLGELFSTLLSGDWFNDYDMSGFWASYTKFETEFLKAIDELAIGMWDGIMEAQGSAEEWGVFEKFFASLEDITWNGSFTGLINDINQKWKDAVDGVDFDWNDVLGKFEWNDGFVSNWSMDWNRPGESFAELGNKIMEGLKNAWENFKQGIADWWNSLSMPEFSFPEFEWPNIDWENPFEKIVETVKGWFSNFSWPEFSWPSFSWPDWTWPETKVEAKELEETKTSVSEDFNSFSWPNFSWPEFSWPEWSFPEIDIDFSGVLSNLKEKFDGMIQSAKEWIGGLDWSFLNPTNWFGGGANAAGGEIQTLDGSFNLGELALNADSISVANIEEQIKPAIDSLIESVKAQISESSPGISEAFNQLFSGINADSLNVESSIVPMIRTAMESVKTTIVSYQEGIGSTFSNMMNLAFTNGMSDINTVFEAPMQSAMQAMNDYLLQGFTQAEQTTLTSWQNMETSTVDSTQRILDNIIQNQQQSNDAILQGLNQSEQTTTTSWQNMETTVSNSMDRIVQAGIQGMSNMNSALSEGYSQAESTSQGTANSIEQIMSSLSSTLYNIGYDAGIGFNNGLAATASTIYATARSIAQGVQRTMKAALDSHSPSRKMFAIGSDSGEGYYLGYGSWKNAISNLSKDMANVSLPNIDKFKNKIGKLPSYAGSFNTNVSQVLQASNEINNSEVVEAVESLEDTVSKLRLNLDSKPIANAVQPHIDRGIGQESRYNERWVMG
ncbi:tape measure protein [Facklamia sp. P13064]|uniref:tape measure protein n=1 Tax=Facklamia sp. P13064 TaxID=3421953 RepID=UPI003D167E8F